MVPQSGGTAAVSQA